MTYKAEKRCKNWFAYRPAKLAPEVDADRNERTPLASRRTCVCGGRAGLVRGFGSLGQLPRRPGCCERRESRWLVCSIVPDSLSVQVISVSVSIMTVISTASGHPLQ